MSEPLTGGCYCGALRYEVTAKPIFKAQCHCRACSHVSGGGPNYFMTIPSAGFAYVAGVPTSFTRSDLNTPVTRESCGECGTHIVTRRPGLDAAILKIGTLDDPSAYRGPRAAIYTAEMQPYQQIPDDIPAFDGLPDP